MRPWKWVSAALVVGLAIADLRAVEGSVQQQPLATFKSGTDLVQVSAVVRDRKGRFVKDLSVRDFEVMASGRPQRISNFRHDMGGVSVALLFDVSGSMSANLNMSREAGSHLLSWLLDQRDEAAIFTFDSRLDEIVSFTKGLTRLPERLNSMKAFGATSLHDAIADAAEQLGRREGRRSAVVVFTDGNDTASRLSPGEVSGIASAIDVPVYILGVVPSIDNPTAETSAKSAARSPLSGGLNNLARWTGGDLFMVSTPAERSGAARQVIDELRHQYLIAFESSGTPGWHPLEVRARSKDLTVRARSGYIAGQSRPVSH
jgi:VWFA-related protein